MSFDEEPRDPFDGGGGFYSKGLFLRTCVECGAAFTGYYESIEVPYYGAHAHAEELESEGLLTQMPFDGVPDCTIWIPTETGKIIGRFV